jgi:short-subunit dehydrogenase/acyl carrier protein
VGTVAEAFGAKVIAADEPLDCAGGDGLLLLDPDVHDLMRVLRDPAVTVPVWTVTQGAVQDVSNPDQAMVWGLGRVAALEQPARWGGLVDLPEDVDPATVAHLAAVVADGGEDQVAIRAEGVFGRRLTPVTDAEEADWSTSGTAVITGGTGGLGGRVARWVVDRGAEHVVLVSRRGPDADGVDSLRAELEAAGASVSVVAADVADRDAMAAVFAEASRPVRTVIHAAGVATVTPIESLTADRLESDLSAKVDGGRILDELTADLTLDAFVLFSSGAAAWGSGGQGGYAAANSFLDALAARRHAQGLAATSVAWGAWAEVGMVVDEAGEADRLRRLGVVPMPPELAVVALERAVAAGDANVVVADVDWERFAPTFTASRPSPLLSELATAEPTESDGEFAQRLSGLPAAQRHELLLDLVTTNAVAILGHPAGTRIEDDQAFRDLGFDSVTAVELRNRLATAVGLTLPATTVFDYPNSRQLAEHLASEFGDPVDVGARSILADLDQVGEALSGGELVGDERRAVVNRLRALLVSWGGGEAEPVVADQPSDDGWDTPEDVFQFIDNELGLSGLESE